MGAIFGKRQKLSNLNANINSRDRAVYELKVQRDRLKKYIASNDVLVERELTIAKQLLSQGKKDRARLVIRKKKFLESSIEKAMAKIANVEELVNSIQFAEMNAQVFAALKDGSEALQSINAQMDIEEVSKLMDNNAEAISYQEEISNLLGTQLSAEDDFAAEQELERIQAEEATKLEMPAVPVQSDQSVEGPKAKGMDEYMERDRDAMMQ